MSYTKYITKIIIRAPPPTLDGHHHDDDYHTASRPHCCRVCWARPCSYNTAQPLWKWALHHHNDDVDDDDDDDDDGADDDGDVDDDVRRSQSARVNEDQGASLLLWREDERSQLDSFPGTKLLQYLWPHLKGCDDDNTQQCSDFDLRNLAPMVQASFERISDLTNSTLTPYC